MCEVKRLIAVYVNVDCTPYQVHNNAVLFYQVYHIHSYSSKLSPVTYARHQCIRSNTQQTYYTQVGWTPLMMACFKGHIDIVRLLVQAKAQVNTQTEVKLIQYSYNCKYISIEGSRTIVV